MNIRETLLEAAAAHQQGIIAKHKANVEVYLNNVVGIGEHSDIIETIELEMKSIAEAQDVLDVIANHF
jgi:hypothetical protein|tara:strand:- start:101 stop:304 length:204 start_codon:yes stop_codon:yes gene_type:complete